MAETTSGEKRSIEQTVELNAPVSAVWKALTVADELTNWFPIEARVKPGVGGHIFNRWSAKEGWEQQWEQPITIWEEERHLRTLWCGADTPEPEQFGVDFFLEPKGEDQTVLRLVHFGFGPAQEGHWDTMYDGVNRGWDFQLCTLKHYVEHHRGSTRRIIFEQAKLGDMPTPEAWERFVGPGGLASDDSLLAAKVGSTIAAPLTTGDEIRGTVRRAIPSKDLQIKTENLGSGLLRIQTDPCGGPNEGDILTLFLGTFDIAKDEIDAMRDRWRAKLSEILPA